MKAWSMPSICDQVTPKVLHICNRLNIKVPIVLKESRATTSNLCGAARHSSARDIARARGADA
jgi:hypothetical protein